MLHHDAPDKRMTPSPARHSSKSCHDNTDEAADFQCHCLGDEIDIKDLSQHRFSADGHFSPSREGSRRLSISSPPSKPMRRRSNESDETNGAYDVETFSFYETDDEATLPYLFKDDEDTTVPSQTRLIRCSTFPMRYGCSPYSPSAYETLSYSPEQKKKVVQVRMSPPRIIFVSLQEDTLLNDNNTVISDITITEENNSNTAPIIIKTKSYSMTSEKNSAHSPSKPIRRSFADDPPRNASFECLRGLPSTIMFPEIPTNQIRPTKAQSGNDSACTRHVIEKHSILSSPLRSPSRKMARLQPMSADVSLSHTELKNVESEKPDLSIASDVEIGSPVLEKPRVAHENMFFRNWTWAEMKQIRRRGRKRNTKSSKLHKVSKNESSSTRHDTTRLDGGDHDEVSIHEHKVEPQNQICSPLSMNSSSRSLVPFEEPSRFPLEPSCRWRSYPSVGIKNVIKRVVSSERMPGKPRRSSSHRQKMFCELRLDKAARSASQNTNSCKQIQTVRSADSALLGLSKRKECVDDYKIATSAALTKHKEKKFDSWKTMQRSQLTDDIREGCILVCTGLAISDGKLRNLRTRSIDDKLSILEILATVEAELRA